MKRPFVSIVIPVYNSQETIESCLNSLLNLNYPKDRYEIILVDDHSTDKSARIVSSFSSINKNIRFFRQKKGKKGPAAARNLGIRKARGEFIASTDADESMFPDWLNKLMPYFSNQKIGAVGALLVEKHYLDSGLAPKIQSILIDPAAKPGIVAAGNVIYRKSALSKAGYFNEFCTFNDLDVDLHSRIRENGYILRPIRKYLGQHKQRHTLSAFYKRMFGFGAAGLIMAFFNFKKAFENRFKNHKGVLHYSALFTLLIAYPITLIASLFFNVNLFCLLIFIALFLMMFYSIAESILHLRRTKSTMLYFPILSFYVFVKLMAIIQGTIYGFFYYIKNKK